MQGSPEAVPAYIVGHLQALKQLRRAGGGENWGSPKGFCTESWVCGGGRGKYPLVALRPAAACGYLV